MQQFIKFGKRLLPDWVKNRVQRILVPRAIQDRDHDLGMFILEELKNFSSERGGRPESLQAGRLKECIFRGKCLREMNEAHQYLQTAIMPRYEQNLYEYYRQQQYLILLTFLSYAFLRPGSLAPHVEPYSIASSRLSKMRILDYGAGLAYGLIHLLRAVPEKIESITIVDLDLVHADFVEYILARLCRNVTVTIIRVTNSDAVPDLGSRTFNLIYGKDIFEHIHDPERLLRTILSKAEPSCIGYFDIRDHGEKHLQHVHPRLSHLSRIICEHSFVPHGKVSGLSEFVKTA
jgi:2-polyprenyl-3-methyl-5-hydroxy-6-metoxy-1,4-benzoquinol methylase